MLRQKVVLNNKLGLHARPASILVKTSTQFSAQIKLIKDNKEANLKSILSILLLKVKDGEEVIIEADGIDEAEALRRIVELMEEKLKIISYNRSTLARQEKDYIADNEVTKILNESLVKSLEKISR